MSFLYKKNKIFPNFKLLDASLVQNNQNTGS